MILKTTDGGSSWERQYCNNAYGLDHVQFVDLNHGWMSTPARSGVYRTQNGGTTWNFISFQQPSSGVFGLFFFSPHLGWATTFNIVKHTTDGGVTWSDINLNSPMVNYSLNDVSVADSTEVWVCGLGGTILKYEYDPTPVKTSDPQPLTPKSYVLHQNYPNPFNPTTTIRFDLPHADQISLNVYDLSGKLVQNLVDHQPYPAGTHQIEWDASDLPSGVYIYQLETLNSKLETLNSKLKTQKAVVLK